MQAVIKLSSSINYGMFKPQLWKVQAVNRPLPPLIHMRYTRKVQAVTWKSCEILLSIQWYIICLGIRGSKIGVKVRSTPM